MSDKLTNIELSFEGGVYTLPYIHRPDVLIEAIGMLKMQDMNDIALCGYVDSVDLARVAPFIDKLIEHIAKLNDTKPKEPATIEEILKQTTDQSVPNIGDPRLHDTAYYLAKVHLLEGGFYRVDSDVPYAIFPAFNPHMHAPGSTDELENPTVDISPEFGIVADFSVISDAMRQTGYVPELIDYRDEPHFFAFRRPAIGQFLLQTAGYSY